MAQMLSTHLPDAGRRIRTLVADDSPVFLLALKEFLAGQAAVELVGAVGDGQSALVQAEALAPDLLILDLMMPKVTGIEVLIRLMRLNQRPRVVVLTLHTAADYRAMAMRHGADAYVSKSELVAELPAVIARLFPRTVSN